MDAAAPGHQPVDVDLHHRAAREGRCERLLRGGVLVRVAELGGDDAAVDDVEVEVGVDELGAAGADGVRPVNGDHLEPAAPGVGRGGEDGELLAGVLGPGVVAVGGRQLDHHRTGPDEARGDVHVVVGDVLALDAGQPDHGVRAVGLQDGVLDLVPAHAPVAVLVDQAALGGHHRAVAVGLDRAALADEVRVGVAQAAPGGEALGDQGVVVVDLLVAPAVEVEDHGVQPAPAVQAEHRRGVAHPQVVGGDRGDHLHRGAAPVLGLARRPVVGGAHHHRLELGDGPRDQGDVLLDAAQAQTPDTPA